VFLLAFVVNTIIGVYLNKNQKIIMERKDDRMTETNEALNNIKMLKLYSWQELFEQRINQKRGVEIQALKKGGMLTSMLIAFSYMFPNMMPAVCFSTYIGLGHSLTLSKAVTCLLFFGLMAGPMIWVPMAISDFI
jgi:ABC-type multidrug transport system fused ATPase/permease subunit